METKERMMNFIRTFIRENGFPPTIREIQKYLGFKSTKGIKVHLDDMERMGWLKKTRGKARGIQIGSGIPVLGSVPAGKPVIRYEYVEEYFDGKEWDGCFLLKVEGDSMRGAHIIEGDMVVVSRSHPETGDIVVAMLDEEVTIKRLIRRQGRYILKPENPDYSEIGGPFEIIGKVVGVIRKNP